MKWLVIMRKQRGMTQTELSSRIGLSQGHLSSLETGRFSRSSVKPKTASALEEVFGMSIDRLLSNVRGIPKTNAARIAAKHGPSRPETAQEAR